MKKLLFASHSPTIDAGAEKSLFELILSSKKAGYDVTVVLPGPGRFSDRLDSESIDYRVVDYKWYPRLNNDTPENGQQTLHSNASYLMNVYSILKDVAPDIVIVNTSVIPWFNYAAYALRIPNILIARELPDARNGLWFPPNTTEYLEDLAVCIDYVFYNSKFTRGEYLKIKSFQSIESSVLYPKVTLSEINTAETPTVIDKQFKLITYGTINPHKNQIEVVEALSYLTKAELEKIHLTLLGRGDEGYIRDIKGLIKSKELETTVDFLPHSNDPLAVVNSHDIVIVPSPAEAFGRVTLEGLLLGKIVIGADAGGTKELLQHKRTGFLYETNNPSSLSSQISWVLNNEDLAKEIAAEGAKKAQEKFIHKDTNEIFIQLISSESWHKQRTPNPLFDKVTILIENSLEKTAQFSSKLDGAQRVIDDLTLSNIELNTLNNRLEARIGRRVRGFIATVLTVLRLRP